MNGKELSQSLKEAENDMDFRTHSPESTDYLSTSLLCFPLYPKKLFHRHGFKSIFRFITYIIAI